MAAPVKNLVDAASLTGMPPYNFVSQKHIYQRAHPVFNTFNNTTITVKSSVFYGMLSATNLVTSHYSRWSLISTVASLPLTLKVPNVQINWKIKDAQSPLVITFPSIYRERTGSRPTEGQLFPRGKT